MNPIPCHFCGTEANVDWEPPCWHLVAMCAGCWGYHIMYELLTPPCPECGIREVQTSNLDGALEWWSGNLRVLVNG